MSLTNVLLMLLAAAPVTAYAMYRYRRHTLAKRKRLADERELYDTALVPPGFHDLKAPPMPPVQQPHSPGLPGKRRRRRSRRRRVPA